MHGEGKFYWPDGRMYEGNFEKDKKSGMGTLHYKDGSKEVGYWDKGIQNGRAYIEYPDPNREKEYVMYNNHGMKVELKV